jgi:DNA-binding IclR family transcriptional regulator
VPTRLQSVERAVMILKAFSLEKPERGVSELSRELGLHKSTASRLMKTLAESGLLTQNPETDRYRLGLDLIGLAAQVTGYLNVREIARSPLRQLAETCQETVNLSVLDGGQVVNLEQFVPHARQIKNVGRVGRRMCLHCTASGKALIAYQPQEQIDQMLQGQLERFTPHTITDPHLLKQDLARVRERGYAIAQEELEEGLNVVAAPVRDHTAQVIASVSVSGPAFRVTPETFRHLAAQAIEMASQISQKLGFD